MAASELYSEGARGTPPGTRRARDKLSSVFSCKMVVLAARFSIYLSIFILQDGDVQGTFPQFSPFQTRRSDPAGPLKAARMGW